jgi:hypothetical protein
MAEPVAKLLASHFGHDQAWVAAQVTEFHPRPAIPRRLRHALSASKSSHRKVGCVPHPFRVSCGMGGMEELRGSRL